MEEKEFTITEEQLIENGILDYGKSGYGVKLGFGFWVHIEYDIEDVYLSSVGNNIDLEIYTIEELMTFIKAFKNTKK